LTKAPVSGGFDLASLLEPLDRDTFLTEHWESRHARVARADEGRYDALFRLADFDALLSRANLSAGDVRLVEAGRTVGVGALSPDRFAGATLERVYASFRSGSTIVLLMVHERWPALRRLSTALAHELSAGCQVNAYLTPPNAQGLDVHYDTHDVFVLQIAGTKHWRLYDSPCPLPLPGQPFRRDEVPRGELAAELDLTPGDLLYVPRGLLHEATSTDSTALHLTVGLLTVTYAELILGAVEEQVERDVRLRESLPPGFARSAEARAGAEARLSGFVAGLSSSILPSGVLDSALDLASVAPSASLDGHLLDLEEIERITRETPVRRRGDVHCVLATGDDSIRLRFHGKDVEFPLHAEPLLRQVLASETSFTAADLDDGLDEEGRLTLVQILVREGLLTRFGRF
jgi:hypothetical protein